MIKKFKTFEKNFTIAKAATIVGFFTLITKLVAIYREKLFASTFGQGPILDSYFSAFRIPDFISNLFILSTLSVAFLPLYAGLLTKDKEKANQLANTILNTSALSIAGFCLILYTVSRPLTHYLVPGFTDGQFEDTLRLTRLFLLSPILFTFSTIFGGILNAKKKFFISSFAPILYNFGIIFGVIYFYPHFGIIGLGYGVIAGAVIQLLLQLTASVWEDYKYRLNFNIRSEDSKKLWKLYIPRIFAFDLSNITLLLGTIIGSALVPGSITALNQAYNLQAVPIGIFGYSIAVAAFPVLSEHFARQDYKAFTTTLRRSINQMMFFIIPVSVLTLIYRAYEVRIILGYGKFDWNDTIRTFQILGIFSFSFISQCLTTLLGRAFFARQNTKIPVAINIFAIVINTIFGIILGNAYGVIGLAVAFVIASIFNAAVLYILLRRQLEKDVPKNEEGILNFFDRDLYTSIVKICTASIIMGIISYIGLKFMGQFVDTHTVIGLVIQCGVSGLLGIFGFFISALLMAIPEAQSALDFVRRK